MVTVDEQVADVIRGKWSAGSLGETTIFKPYMGEIQV